MQLERFRSVTVTVSGTLMEVRLVKEEASSVLTEAGSVSHDRSVWSLRFPTFTVLRPVHEERSSESSPSQPEMSSVVTLAGKVRLVRPVQPEISNVVRAEKPDRSSSPIKSEQLLALSVVIIPLLAPKPSPAVVRSEIFNFVPEISRY